MDLEARIRRLEDLHDIQNLITAYGIAMDERDAAATRELFTPDATLTSKDGVFAADGLDEILETYAGRWEVLGPTSHIVHGAVLHIDPDDPDRATGTVPSHAEVVRNGESMLVSIIYEDEYRRHEGKWKFSSREMGFFYYMPASGYVETMKSSNRNLAYGDARPADYPMALRDA